MAAQRPGVEDAVFGAATPIPYNTIFINNLTPPAGSMFLVNYDDWLHTVITHEYAHVLHLDTASGLPLVLRRVFGRVPFVVFPFLTTLPNLWQPIWMIEGLATHEETELGTSDRRDNPFADMLLRMAVLEHDFPTIDQADGLDRWPAGQAPYLFGARFYQYLAKQFGEHVPTEIGRQYADRPLAFFVGSTGVTILGMTYRQLWDNWRRLLAQRFDAQRADLEAEGLTATTSLTARGGMILGPAVSPDGSTIAYTENSLDTLPTLRAIRIDGTGDRAITRRTSRFPS